MSIFHTEPPAPYLTTSPKEPRRTDLPSSFVGLSGHYYIRNQNSNKYAYAKYRNKEDLSIASGYMGHISIEEALSDQ